LLHEPKQNIAAVVDPAEAEPVLQKLQELGAGWWRSLIHTIIVTMWAISSCYNGLSMSKFMEKGSGRIPGIQVFLQEGDHVHFADREAEIIFVPGHTARSSPTTLPPEA